MLKGEGEPGKNGGAKGNVYITINLKKHSIFTRNGDDVYCEVPITFTQATLGAELEIPLVDGTKMKYKIPEATQTGTKFTIIEKVCNNMNIICYENLFITFYNMDVVELPKLI